MIHLERDWLTMSHPNGPIRRVAANVVIPRLQVGVRSDCAPCVAALLVTQLFSFYLPF